MTVRSSLRRSGQSLIETCIALGLICLIFFGLFQISQLFAAKEILNHAAARGARAKTVGFNWWMVQKSIRVAAIPNAGRMTVPDFSSDNPYLRQLILNLRPGLLWETALSATPTSMQYPVERARIPEYLNSENGPRASWILDYADWDSVQSHHSIAFPGTPEGGTPQSMITVNTRQDVLLWVPMHRTFYAADRIPIEGRNSLESHYEYYLDDMFW